MKLAPAPAALLAAAWLAHAPAQAPAPVSAPPAGFVAVPARDAAYQFFVPPDATPNGTRDRPVGSGPGRCRVTGQVFTLADGTRLEASAADPLGPGAKPQQVVDALLAAEKLEGFAAGAAKKPPGPNPDAREYRLTGTAGARRAVYLPAKGRVFVLVASGTPEGVDAAAVTAFLQSFGPAPVAGARKPEAAPPPVQLLAKWTARWEEMEAPSGPAAGRLRGKEFQFDAATLDAAGLLLRSGPAAAPAAEFRVMLPIGPAEDAAGGTWEVRAARAPRPGSAAVAFTLAGPPGKPASAHAYAANFALKVAFAPAGRDGTVAGTIFFCSHDESKSFVAGSFTAKVAPRHLPGAPGAPGAPVGAGGQ